MNDLKQHLEMNLPDIRNCPPPLFRSQCNILKRLKTHNRKK